MNEENKPIADQLASIFSRMRGHGMTDEELDNHERAERKRKRLIAAGLDRRVQMTGKPAQLAEAIGRKCSGDGAVIVLCGARGTGKTTVAKEVQWQHIDKDRSAGRYSLFQDVFESLRILYGEFADKRENGASWARERLVSAGLLILDEVHEVLTESKQAHRVLNDLVIRRHEARNDTVIITNQPKESTGLDSSILSRANACGFVYEPTWTPFR